MIYLCKKQTVHTVLYTTVQKTGVGKNFLMFFESKLTKDLTVFYCNIF